MKAAIIISLSLLIALFGFAQKSSIELELSVKYGEHSRSKQWSFNDIHREEIRAMGASTGLALNYKRKLGRSLHGRIGLGYNRLDVDRVKYTALDNGLTFDVRQFNYTSFVNGYTFSMTGKYNYRNIMLTTGADYEKAFFGNFNFVFGGDIIGLYTFSQKYYFGTTKQAKPVKTNEHFLLSLGLNAHAGVLYKIPKGKFYLHPKILLSVYQRMFADKMLAEDNTRSRPQKWLGGGGLSISVGRYF